LACRIFKAGDQVEIFTKVGQIGKKHRKIPLEFDFQIVIYLFIFYFLIFDDFGDFLWLPGLTLRPGQHTALECSSF